MKWPKYPRRTRSSTRKTPHRHSVRAHKREGYQVHSYTRGKGKPSIHSTIRHVLPGKVKQISQADARKLHAARSPMARQVDEARLAKIAPETDLWAHTPGRLDLYGIDTPGEKVAPGVQKAKILINKPSSETMTLWGKVFATPHEEDYMALGMYLDATHVAGLVLNPGELPDSLMGKSEKEGFYGYISSDALKKAGEFVQIGESTYSTEYIVKALKVLGKEDITFYNAKDYPLIMVNSKDIAISVAPCMGVGEGYGAPTAIPQFKEVNMTPTQEKAERTRKRDLAKNMKYGVEQLVKSLEKQGVGISRLLPYGYEEKPHKDKINYLYKKLKKDPRNFEDYAISLFGRETGFELGPEDKDIVSYKNTPPEWWTRTDGLGLDKDVIIVSRSDYTKIVSEHKKKREKQKIKQAKINAGIKRGYSKLKERSEKLKTEIQKIYFITNPSQAQLAKQDKLYKQQSAVDAKIKSLEYKHGAWHLTSK